MRLPTLTYEKLDPRQRESWNKHAERRDKPVGPYLTWIHSPELMDKVSPLSNYFRFDCNLPVKLREFGICVTARYWDAQYSWNAHVDKARAAGVPDQVILQPNLPATPFHAAPPGAGLPRSPKQCGRVASGATQESTDPTDLFGARTDESRS